MTRRSVSRVTLKFFGGVISWRVLRSVLQAGVDDSAGAHTMAGRELALTAKRAGKQSKAAALCRKATILTQPGLKDPGIKSKDLLRFATSAEYFEQRPPL